MSAKTPPPMRQLRSAVHASVAVVILLVFALVVWSPWRTQGAAVVLTGGTADDVVTFTLSASHTGDRTADVRLAPRRGVRTAAPETVVTVQAVLPTAGLASPATSALPAGDGHYRVAAVDLMMPGRWEAVVGIEGSGRHDRLVFPLTISN